MQNAILKIQGIYKYFTQGQTVLPVLKGISATFAQGNSYAITGVSGSGKSTLLHIIAGLDTPSQGAIYFNNDNINNYTPDQKNIFLNKYIGTVFQKPYLIKELLVWENVIMPGLIGSKDYSSKEYALQLLAKVGLTEKADSTVSSLSGGQQQRVALARALCNKPLFLIADEPTGNLDEQTGKVIIDLLLECQKTWNMGLIISSHDDYVTQEMQHILQLHDGHIIENK